MNRNVMVQIIGQPKTRRRVGVLTDGCMPDDGDLDRWNIDRKNVIDWTWMRVAHMPTFVIEVANLTPAKPRAVVRPKDLRELEVLAKRWAEIASEGEAAPTGSMLRTINRLLTTVKHQRTFLRQVRDWLDTVRLNPNQDGHRIEMIEAMNGMLGIREYHAKARPRSQ